MNDLNELKKDVEEVVESLDEHDELARDIVDDTDVSFECSPEDPEEFYGSDGDDCDDYDPDEDDDYVFEDEEDEDEYNLEDEDNYDPEEDEDEYDPEDEDDDFDCEHMGYKWEDWEEDDEVVTLCSKGYDCSCSDCVERIKSAPSMCPYYLGTEEEFKIEVNK